MKQPARYTKKQAAADKALREHYKALTLPYDRLRFMSEATPAAIYLCNLDSEAENMEAKWYPMLAGFQLADGEKRPAGDTYEKAISLAQGFKEAYARKFAAYNAACTALTE